MLAVRPPPRLVWVSLERSLQVCLVHILLSYELCVNWAILKFSNSFFDPYCAPGPILVTLININSFKSYTNNLVSFCFFLFFFFFFFKYLAGSQSSLPGVPVWLQEALCFPWQCWGCGGWTLGTDPREVCRVSPLFHEASAETIIGIAQLLRRKPKAFSFKRCLYSFQFVREIGGTVPRWSSLVTSTDF